MLAATGNVANYFEALKQGQTEEWHYDFDKLSVAAATIYGYLCLIPFLLWVLLRYLQVDIKWAQIVCIYGYSFSVYVPIAVSR